MATRIKQANAGPNPDSDIANEIVEGPSRQASAATNINANNQNTKEINNLMASGKMGMSSEEFWKPPSNDYSKGGFGKSSAKVVPMISSAASGIGSRPPSAQSQYKYQKERDRDPAVLMAAMNYRRLHELRDETNDTKFSYWCSSAEKICNRSNSQPSFRIYYNFIKRFTITLFIVGFLHLCALVYNVSCDWYSDKDKRFVFEETFLGNIDGLEYLTSDEYGSEIGKENADTGLPVILGVDLASTVFLFAFLVYQIYISKTELYSKDSPISIRDYAVKISGISKKCEPGIEREIQKCFITFGKIIEIIPIKDYERALTLELKLRQVGELIGDLKAKDQLQNTNNQGKINKLISIEQKLIDAQKKVYNNMSHTKSPTEAVVVFDTVQSRNDCLANFAKYSRWYSPLCKRMPSALRLHDEYSYKVMEAPEPFDYRIENWHVKRWIPWLVFILAFTVVLALGILIMSMMVIELDKRFDKVPIYNTCAKYDLDGATTETYTNNADATQEEISCFCRSLSFADVNDDCEGDADNEGCKDLCQDWIDYHENYYRHFNLTVWLMMLITCCTCAFFKFALSSRLYKVRYNSTRYIMTASSVCFCIFFILGFIPEFFFDSSTHDIDREWYLKSGSLYCMYFMLSLLIYPAEVVGLVISRWLQKKCTRKRKVLQKELNALYVGRKLDYSVKIGRLMGYTLFCFYHGTSMPILYLILFAHFVIFITIEKAMMLKFYRKLDPQAPWIRQFIIHTLLVAILLHCFRAIGVLGNEDIFPGGYEIATATKEGEIIEYYKPVSRDYGEMMTKKQGVGYLVTILILIIYYVLSWWINKVKFLHLICGFGALFANPGRNLIPATLLRRKQSRIEYINKIDLTYDFKKIKRYSEAVIEVESHLPDSVHGQPSVSHADSNYNMKSEANSGDDALEKDESNQIPNIYRNDNPGSDVDSNNSPDNLQSEKLDSEELEDIELH